MELVAEEAEYVYGGGEQFTYLNLRGRSYPIWVREQGVGRNLSSDVTQVSWTSMTQRRRRQYY
jgi:alpha-glucosidase